MIGRKVRIFICNLERTGSDDNAMVNPGLGMVASMVAGWLGLGLGWIPMIAPGWGEPGVRIAVAPAGTEIATVAWSDQRWPEASTAPNLGPGSRGAEVARLQTWLQTAGYVGITVDGVYGPTTAAIVAEFQQDQGLEVDGRVGPQTWSTLRWVINPAAMLADFKATMIQTLPLTPLTFTRPEPPPSPLWLIVMPLVPLVGGGITYLRHRCQAKRMS